MFFATTEESATWLLTKPELLTSLSDALLNERLTTGLRDADVADGPLRLSGTADGTLVLFWNADYLSGSGEERWGFLKLDAPLGLRSETGVLRRVLQTELEVTSLRLRNLLLDSKLIHRSYEDNTNTIRADRGDAGASLNLAYVEGAVSNAGVQRRSILFVGPAFDFVDLRDRAVAESQRSSTLIDAAQTALNSKARRPLLDYSLNLQESLPLTQALPLDRATVVTKPERDDKYSTAGWSFDDWLKSPERLSSQQLSILQGNVPLAHPLRIVGPAGSGKTLIMQLLALKHLRAAREDRRELSVLYIVHNAAMREALQLRFAVLSPSHDFCAEGPQRLRIQTLSEYALDKLDLDEGVVVDKDAYQTKLFQVAQISDAISMEIQSRASRNEKYVDARIIKLLIEQPRLREIFAQLIASEVSVAIKGHGLTGDRQRYVFADRPLSRLHKAMNSFDREFVFSVFERYKLEVFDRNGFLDTDDVALTLSGNLGTPLWQLKRATTGFDMVFVDETQLFNENERRIFHWLTKRSGTPQPIALALDEGQELFGQTSAGLSSLGIEDIEEERLPANHRSTKEIVELAFFVISKSSDLFGPGFPKYTVEAVTIASDDKKAKPPRLDVVSAESRSIGRFVSKRISELRSHNIGSICVICHAEIYWDDVVHEVREKAAEVSDRVEILERRGQSVEGNAPFIAISRPAYVGGQEFDAVIAVGLEYGLVPPRVVGNEALEAALGQQAIREMYLSFSRARYQLVVVNGAESAPNDILREALELGLIQAKR